MKAKTPIGILSAILFCLSANGAAADVFLNPANNMWTPEKVFSRPYAVQSTPLPQVWQTGAETPRFRRAWRTAITPETEGEHALRLYSKQIEAKDMLNDFDGITRYNPESDQAEINALLREVLDIAELSEQTAADALNERDAEWLRDLRLARENDAAGTDGRLKRLSAYFSLLDDFAADDIRLRRVLAAVDAAQKAVDYREVEEMTRPMLRTELDARSSFDVFETQNAREAVATGDVLSFLLINDVADLSTGMNLLNDEAVWSGGGWFENAPVDDYRPRSASLLDSGDKNHKIRTDEDVPFKKRFFDMLEKAVNGDKSKDVK